MRSSKWMTEGEKMMEGFSMAEQRICRCIVSSWVSPLSEIGRSNLYSRIEFGVKVRMKFRVFPPATWRLLRMIGFLLL